MEILRSSTHRRVKIVLLFPEGLIAIADLIDISRLHQRRRGVISSEVEEHKAACRILRRGHVDAEHVVGKIVGILDGRNGGAAAVPVEGGIADLPVCKVFGKFVAFFTQWLPRLFNWCQTPQRNGIYRNIGRLRTGNEQLQIVHDIRTEA